MSESKKDPTTAMGKIYQDRQLKVKDIEGQIDELMETIREKKDLLENQRKEMLSDYSERLANAAEDFTFEDLLDVEKAKEYYEAFWSQGYGIKNSADKYNALFEDTYISIGGYKHYEGSDRSWDSPVYIAPQICIPSNKDSDKMKLTAEKLEAIYRVNMEIAGEGSEPVVTILSDDLQSPYIQLNTENNMWEIWTNYGYSNHCSKESLLDLLWLVPTYY